MVNCEYLSMSNMLQDIKAFYMRINDDGKTVAAMDLLVPKVWNHINHENMKDVTKTSFDI